MSDTILEKDDKIKYSKVLSSLLSSGSIIAFSILCLLNNLSLDLYSAFELIKVVIPASICFWFIGFVIGTILDRLDNKIIENEIKEEKKAYEIPSMFSMDTQIDDNDEFGGMI